MRSHCVLAAAALALAVSVPAPAGLIETGPFVGEISDPLNYPEITIVSSFDIFGGAARLHSHDDETTYIHYLRSSTLSGNSVTPRTGSRILGFTQGPGIFEFDEPVRRFGAWWNTNTGVNDALVEFFDAAGDPIGSDIATVIGPQNVWTWNGWESDTPIKTIRVTGFGLASGFMWFDDLEMSIVPAPGAAIVLLALLGTPRRRGRRREA